MTDITEAANNQSSLNATLRTGLDTLSADQTVAFVKFVKIILPLDGFIFWVRADLLSSSAIFNSTQFNRFEYNAVQQPPSGANIVRAQGSLHFATQLVQDETRSYSINRMTFTSQQEVTDLNSVSPSVMYIAYVGSERFSFSQRQNFYKQADLYHYTGNAVYSTMESQIIEHISALDTRNVIVSNSLPIWLTLNQYMPMYPSFLVPSNISPPFAAVHIPSESTTALQATPLIDSQSNHYQLVCEDVKITIFGLRNFNALDFQDYILQYSLLTDNIGIMNFPVIQDEKQEQVELQAIAMKKSITFKVSYYQTRIQDIARRYITSCFVHYYFGAPKTYMVFAEDLALPYEGPFSTDEALPIIVFLNTTQIGRGVAFTESTGNSQFQFEDINGTVVITVNCIAGNHYPQITFPNGPIMFYINQVLRPFCTVADPSQTDISFTLGSVPYTWPIPQ